MMAHHNYPNLIVNLYSHNLS